MPMFLLRSISTPLSLYERDAIISQCHVNRSLDHFLGFLLTYRKFSYGNVQILLLYGYSYNISNNKLADVKIIKIKIF